VNFRPEDLADLRIGMQPSPARTAWARMIYPDARECDTADEYARFIHADLARMGADELHRELGLAQLRALADDDPSDWLCERLRELRAALATRPGKPR